MTNRQSPTPQEASSHMETKGSEIKRTPYQLGFYDGSRGLSAAYYPAQPGDPFAEYRNGFAGGRRERDKLNRRPINPALKPEYEAATKGQSK